MSRKFQHKQFLPEDPQKTGPRSLASAIVGPFRKVWPTTHLIHPIPSIDSFSSYSLFKWGTARIVTSSCLRPIQFRSTIRWSRFSTFNGLDHIKRTKETDVSPSYPTERAQTRQTDSLSIRSHFKREKDISFLT